jgi:hypothetical protein
MPKPLPFARMKVQRLPIRLNSPALGVAVVKAVSVTAYVPETGAVWTVVPQAARPVASVAVVTEGEELLQEPATETVASSLTTMEVGRFENRLLGTISRFTDKETKPFGVTGQEQQEKSCSSGENAYTFTQIKPLLPTPASFAPVFVILMKESPTFRLAA